MRNNLSEPLDRCYMADEAVSSETRLRGKFPAIREFNREFSVLWRRRHKNF
jgi:hypothetical protein